MRTALAPLVLLAFCAAAIAQGEYALVHRFTAVDGLPQDSITSAAPAADGGLWLSSFAGLTHFDGFHLKTLGSSSDPAFPVSRVSALLAARDRTLWVVSESEGLYRFDGESFEAHPYPRLPGDHWEGRGIHSLFEEDTGSLLLVGESLLRFAKGRYEQALPEPWNQRYEAAGLGTMLRSARAQSMILLVGSEVWSLEGRGVDVLARDIAPRGAVQLSDGTFLASGSAGEWRWFSAAFEELGRWPHGFEDLKFLGALPGQPASPTLVADGKRFLIGAVGPDGPRLNPLRGARNSASANARWSWLAPGGDLWCGGDSTGLLQFRPERFRRFESHGGRAIPTVLQLDGSEPGSIRFFGRLRLWNVREGHLRPLDIEGDWELPPTGIATGRDGRTWVIDPMGITMVPKAAGAHFPAEGPGYGVLQTLASGVVAGASARVLWWFLPERPLRFELPNFGWVRQLVSEGPDRLHVVMDRGIVTFDPLGVRAEHPLSADGPSLGLRDLIFTPQGTRWLSTYGKGLARWNADDSLDYVGLEDGLPNAFLQGLLLDGRDRLWSNSNEGVFRVELRQLERAADGEEVALGTRRFATGEGNGSGAVRDAEGRLWFGTVRGVVCLDPRELGPRTLPPPRPYIRSFSADGQRLKRSSQRLEDAVLSLEMPPGSRLLNVALSATAFTEQENVRWRYRLLGLSDTWIPSSEPAQAAFAGLSPGRYRFEVQAHRAGTDWVDVGLAREVVLKPTLLQNRFLHVALASLALLAGGWFVRQRILRLRTEREELARASRHQREQDAARLTMERSLREQATLEALGRLSGSVAHDFNNILMAIRAHADLLQESPTPKTAGQAESIAAIAEATHRASLLTQQLLAFSEPDPIHRTRLDLHEIILRLEPMLRRLFPKRAQLTLDSHPGEARVSGDVTRVESLIAILILNARDAIAPGGTVSVRVRGLAAPSGDAAVPPNGPRPAAARGEALRPEDPVSALFDAKPPHQEGAPPMGLQGNICRIEVRDDGRDIPTEALSQVFDALGGSGRSGSGTGLGLATVRAIVQGLGGAIRVTSHPEDGTCFVVDLPDPGPFEAASSQATDSAEVQEWDRQELGGAETLLLVDDFVPGLEVLTTRLSQLGYEVLTATGTEEAVRISRLRESAIDALITDVIMPEGSGPELAQALLAKDPELCVIFVTGYAPRNMLALPEPLDRAAVLTKPFSPEHLAKVLRRHLDRKAATGE